MSGVPDERAAMEMLLNEQVSDWNHLRAQFPEWIPKLELDGKPLDLHNKKLNGANLSRANATKVIFLSAELNRADFSGADCSEANLNGVHAEGTDFTGARMFRVSASNASFLTASFRRARMVFVNFKKSTFDDVHFTGGNLEGTRFDTAALDQCDFTKALLSHVLFTNTSLFGCTFDRASFRLSDLSRATITASSFEGAKYLFGPDRATMLDIRDAEGAVYGARRDHVTWARLRWVSTIKLFGVSYLGIVAIIVYATCARWFNDGAEALRGWATEAEDVPGGGWIARVPDMPIPGHFGVQVIMIALLAIGATVYQWRCPELVKENTETRWTRELEEPLLEYRVAAYSSVKARYVAAFCFATGGLYTLGYLAWRTIDVVKYIFGQ